MPRSVLFYSLLVGAKNVLRKIGAPPSGAKNLLARIRKESLRRDELDPMIRTKILEVCEDDIRQTQDLIRRDLSTWLECQRA
jgi:hypothetical protein